MPVIAESVAQRLKVLGNVKDRRPRWAVAGGSECKFRRERTGKEHQKPEQWDERSLEHRVCKASLAITFTRNKTSKVPYFFSRCTRSGITS